MFLEINSNVEYMCSYLKADYDSMKIYLSQIDLDERLADKDTKEQWSEFSKVIQGCVAKFLSMKKLMAKVERVKWMN